MKRGLILGVVLSLLLVNVVGAFAAPLADTSYVVQKGDTLAALAQRFGVSITAIAQANNLKDINKIYVGQRLVIPNGASGGGSGTGTGTATCASPYVVQKGDTLGKIAKKCGVSATDIANANKLKDIHLIYVGQQLLIPGGSTNPVPTPTPTPTPIASVLIVNPSFEGGWTTDSRGNQHPNGWTFTTWGNGSTMPFPTKQQQGSTVTAVSSDSGEYVHKLTWQLPPDEQQGQGRALLLEGGTVYKVFGRVGPHALQLSQTLVGQPGTTLRITVYILGETWDKPATSTSKLEDDHFVVAVKLGSAEDRRTYAVMKTHFDLPGNQRAWNKFSVQAVVPDSGQLPLALTFQQNWSGRTDFFVDNLSGEVVK